MHSRTRIPDIQGPMEQLYRRNFSVSAEQHHCRGVRVPDRRPALSQSWNRPRRSNSRLLTEFSKCQREPCSDVGFSYQEFCRATLERHQTRCGGLAPEYQPLCRSGGLPRTGHMASTTVKSTQSAGSPGGTRGVRLSGGWSDCRAVGRRPRDVRRGEREGQGLVHVSAFRTDCRGFTSSQFVSSTSCPHQGARRAAVR
jgi:hypothetical protein